MSAINRPGSKRWPLWCLLLAAAGWLALFGDKSPSASVASVSMPTRPQAPASPGAQVMAEPKQPLEALAQREHLISTLPAAAASGSAPAMAGRDLFTTRNWSPPAPPPAPAAPPVAPSVPYAFLGKKLEGTAWEVFLSRGEQTFIVREGQTVESVWRVVTIAPPAMTITYLPMDQVQTFAIGDPR